MSKNSHSFFILAIIIILVVEGFLYMKIQQMKAEIDVLSANTEVSESR